MQCTYNLYPNIQINRTCHSTISLALRASLWPFPGCVFCVVSRPRSRACVGISHKALVNRNDWNAFLNKSRNRARPWIPIRIRTHTRTHTQGRTALALGPPTRPQSDQRRSTRAICAHHTLKSTVWDTVLQIPAGSGRFSLMHVEI